VVNAFGAEKGVGQKMFKEYSLLDITPTAKKIIMQAYDNEPILEYAGGIVKEYKVDSNLLDSNIDLSLTILTKFFGTDVPEHTDDGRSSCLIVPLSNDVFTVSVSRNEHKVLGPFILDTSLPHSANVSKETKILSIDLGLSYDETVRKLSHGVKIDAK
jgi:hypothetical protein